MARHAARIDVDRTSGLATLEWSRPHAANAFDADLARELAGVLTELDADPGIEVCVMQGRGRHFTSGWDLSDLSKRSLADSSSELREYFGAGTELLETISAMRALVVGRHRGTTAGFGVAIAARCDLAVADPDSRFGCPEISVGLVPRLVAADLVGLFDDTSTTLAWLTTGRYFTAEEAHAAGVANLVLEEGDFEALLKMWRALVTENPGCLTATKAVTRELRRLPRNERRRHAVGMTVHDLVTGRRRS